MPLIYVYPVAARSENVIDGDREADKHRDEQTDIEPKIFREVQYRETSDDNTA